MLEKDAVKRLDEHFEGVKPDGDDVRGQGATFVRAHWLNQWAGIDLDRPAVLVVESPRIHVTRQDLLDGARKVETESDVIDFFVRVAGWGSGTSARSVARTAAVLRETGAPRALLESARAARELPPVEAYRALNHRGQFKMKGFGPSFFTKWMYFNGYEQTSTDGVPPLILDRRVARSLGWKKKYGWPSSEYREYLDTVREIRDRWAPGAEYHVIEYALFKAGGK